MEFSDEQKKKKVISGVGLLHSLTLMEKFWVIVGGKPPCLYLETTEKSHIHTEEGERERERGAATRVRVGRELSFLSPQSDKRVWPN